MRPALCVIDRVRRSTVVLQEPEIGVQRIGDRVRLGSSYRPLDRRQLLGLGEGEDRGSVRVVIIIGSDQRAVARPQVLNSVASVAP